MLDEWTRSIPITDAELANLRFKAIQDIDCGEIEFTCDGCARAKICTLVYDGYNTNGDCLYDK